MREPHPLFPRGYLQACLHLLLEESPRHGYELTAELERLGIQSKDKGLVYRALREMESEGLALSSWEPPATGPSRRMYELTADGRARLRLLTKTLLEAQHAIAAFVDRFDRVEASRRGAAA